MVTLLKNDQLNQNCYIQGRSLFDNFWSVPIYNNYQLGKMKD